MKTPSEHKMSAEEQAREVFNRIFKNVSPWTEKEGLAELTAIIRERDELKSTNNVLHQLMKAAETRGVDKATIELGEQINKLTEDFHRVIAERDAYREKAEALDWLEKQCPSCEFKANEWDVCYIDFKQPKVMAFKGKTLHPALAALEQLYTSCGHLRLRCEMQAPKLKAFSDWDENSKAMRTAENVLSPSNHRP